MINSLQNSNLSPNSQRILFGFYLMFVEYFDCDLLIGRNVDSSFNFAESATPNGLLKPEFVSATVPHIENVFFKYKPFKAKFQTKREYHQNMSEVAAYKTTMPVAYSPCKSHILCSASNYSYFGRSAFFYCTKIQIRALLAWPGCVGSPLNASELT